MTEQYQQTNINQPMSGARRVDQGDIDTTLPVPGVPLNADDEYILLRDDDEGGVYAVFLPDVREVEGKDLVFKVDPNAGAGLPTLWALQTTTPVQTIEGIATLGPLAAGNSVVLRADPPDFSTTPPTASTNWSIIKLGIP